jgi:hypothetical protein
MNAMASDKQIAANRANAQRSTGPRTAAGRAKSSRNAYRHGLSVPMQPDPQAVEAMALAIAGETAGEAELRAARALAEAQFELKRIRATRLAALPTDLDRKLDPQPLTGLCGFDRYERLALSWRKAALRWFETSRPHTNAVRQISDLGDWEPIDRTNPI